VCEVGSVVVWVGGVVEWGGGVGDGVVWVCPHTGQLHQTKPNQATKLVTNTLELRKGIKSVTFLGYLGGGLERFDVVFVRLIVEESNHRRLRVFVVEELKL
jgi:hypothetical protein